MSTAQTIIEDAHREISVLGEGDSLSAAQLSDSLRALNRLLALESNNLTFDYSASQETIALTGQSSFTIGATGTIVSTRPIRIDSAQAVLGGITYDVKVIDVNEWDSIAMKTTSGSVPEVIFYDPTLTNGTVRVWPQATCTLNMRVTSLVTSFAALSTTLNMPEGYESWMIAALAIAIAPQYPSSSLSPLTVQSARKALKIIKRTNKSIPKLSLENLPASNSSGGLEILAG